jgi:hypothetical protein
MLHCIILLHGHEHNTLGSKKMWLVFLPCEVGTLSSTSPVLVTHVIKLWINPLINQSGRLLAVNVCDVICIQVKDRDIINPLRREARTINQRIGLTCRNSWRCRGAVVWILGAVCKLVSRERRERSRITSSLCGKWGGTITSVIFIVIIITRSSGAVVIRLLVCWAIFIFCSSIRSDWLALQYFALPFRPHSRGRVTEHLAPCSCKWWEHVISFEVINTSVAIKLCFALDGAFHHVWPSFALEPFTTHVRSSSVCPLGI